MARVGTYLTVLWLASTVIAGEWSLIGDVQTAEGWGLIDRPDEPPVPAEKPVERSRYIVYVGATWCGPCQQTKRDTFPAMVKSGWKIGSEVDSHVRVLDYDADDVSRYQISVVPTWILMDGGREISRATGFMDPVQVDRFYRTQIQRVAATKPTRFLFFTWE